MTRTMANSINFNGLKKTLCDCLLFWLFSIQRNNAMQDIKVIYFNFTKNEKEPKPHIVEGVLDLSTFVF